MDLRPLGSSGLAVTPIGLGLAAIGRPGYITLGRGEDFAGARIKGLLKVPAAMRFLSSDLCSSKPVLGDSSTFYHSKARGIVRRWPGPAGLEQYCIETLAIGGE